MLECTSFVNSIDCSVVGSYVSRKEFRSAVQKGEFPDYLSEKVFTFLQLNTFQVPSI